MTVTTKKPSEIFAGCIEDIDAGMWVCGELSRELSETPNEGVKGHGCALGLIAINGGNAHKQELPSGACLWEIDYHTDRRWNDASVEAMKILAEAVPGETHSIRNTTPGDIQDHIINFNDGLNEHAKEDVALARQWFDDARKLALSRGL